MVSAVSRCRPTRSGRVATRPGGRRRRGRPVPRGKQPLQQPAGLLSSFTPTHTRNNNNSPCVLRTLSRLSFAKHSLAARTPARAHIQVSPRACALHAPRPSAGRTAHLVPVTHFAKHSLAARTPARAHIQALGFLARPPLAPIFCGPALSRPCGSWLVCVCPGIFPYVHANLI